jgi:hypothetical protein
MTKIFWLCLGIVLGAAINVALAQNPCDSGPQAVLPGPTPPSYTGLQPPVACQNVGGFIQCY